jgi:hypothetical protein
VSRRGEKLGTATIGDTVIGVMDTIGIIRLDRTGINKAIVMAATTMNTIDQDILQSIVLGTVTVMLMDKLSIIKTISNQLKTKVNNSLAVALLILRAIPA